MYNSKGFTFIEFIIFVIILTTVAMIALPKLVEARKRSNETSAKHSLQIISLCQKIYYRSFEQYANDISYLYLNGQLTSPSLNKANATKNLSNATAKNGYLFASNTNFNNQKYMIFAVPNKYDLSGNFTFFLNEEGSIYKSDIREEPEKIIQRFQTPDSWSPEENNWKLCQD